MLHRPTPLVVNEELVAIFHIFQGERGSHHPATLSSTRYGSLGSCACLSTSRATGSSRLRTFAVHNPSTSTQRLHFRSVNLSSRSRACVARHSAVRLQQRLHPHAGSFPLHSGWRQGWVSVRLRASPLTRHLCFHAQSPGRLPPDVSRSSGCTSTADYCLDCLRYLRRAASSKARWRLPLPPDRRRLRLGP